MSAETKRGKAVAKADYEKLIERSMQEPTPRPAYLAIQDNLEDCETKVPEGDFQRGYFEQFVQCHKNWRRRGNNAFDFDRWTKGEDLSAELGLPTLNDVFNEAFERMTRGGITEAINKIWPGDEITIRIKEDCDFAVFHYLRGMLHSRVITMNDIELMQLARIMNGDKFREVKMKADDDFNKDWFAARLARDLDWIKVKSLTVR